MRPSTLHVEVSRIRGLLDVPFFVPLTIKCRVGTEERTSAAFVREDEPGEYSLPEETAYWSFSGCAPGERYPPSIRLEVWCSYIFSHELVASVDIPWPTAVSAFGRDVVTASHPLELSAAARAETDGGGGAMGPSVDCTHFQTAADAPPERKLHCELHGARGLADDTSLFFEPYCRVELLPFAAEAHAAQREEGGGDTGGTGSGDGDESGGGFALSPNRTLADDTRGRNPVWKLADNNYFVFTASSATRAVRISVLNAPMVGGDELVGSLDVPLAAVQWDGFNSRKSVVSRRMLRGSAALKGGGELDFSLFFLGRAPSPPSPLLAGGSDGDSSSISDSSGGGAFEGALAASGAAPASAPLVSGGSQRRSSLAVIACTPVKCRLLQQPQLRYLVARLPAQCRGCQRLSLVYSAERHGFSTEAFLHLTRHRRHTLLLVQTTKGHVFGGFAADDWVQTAGAYYGSGECFLFGAQSGGIAPSVACHAWTGADFMCMYSDAETVGMGGGGGGFGLCLTENLSRGTTQACATFGNRRPLCPDEAFHVAQVEVWAAEETGQDRRTRIRKSVAMWGKSVLRS
jgi:hypothetical protein